MKITLNDDKKEKYQSVTASASETFSEPMSFSDISLTAFGANEAEAKQNLLLAANEIKQRIEGVIQELSGDIENKE